RGWLRAAPATVRPAPVFARARRRALATPPPPPPPPPPTPAVTAALVVAAAGAATILGALFFQYGLGVVPCPLCLDQRKVYYVAIPLAIVVAIAAWRHAPRPLVVTGLGVLALTFLFGAGLAACHAGVVG